MGRNKQTLVYGGVPLVTRAVDVASAVCGPDVLVVTGARREEVERCMENREVQVVYNAAWESGLASSLGAGVAALGEGCAAALVLACDQPAITTADLAELVRAWRKRPDRPAAAAYDDVIGVPAILPASLFPSIRDLRGDQGARGLLRGGDPITSVPMASAALDLDVPSDLERLRSEPPSNGESCTQEG